MSAAHETKDVQDQSTALSRKRVLIIFVALALALFITCLDQTSVATSMAKIGEDLDAVSSIAWVGTSFLIAMTAFLLVNGRLSDIFGRKGCLLICLILLGLGDLLCGFAKSGVMLFIFRAISGIGAGGVNSLVMVIVSDITTLKERGKYQGILESMIALGNGVGPLVGGAFSQQVMWRWTFWFVVPLAALAAGVVWLLLPKTNVAGDWKMKVAQIDYRGVLTSMAAVVLLLIPISGGGSTYKWNSALVIVMLTTGGILAIVFVIVEWKLSPIPLMPLRLFRKRNAKILLGNNFLMGVVYFTDLYFIPLYFQNVRGYSPILSGIMILPLIVAFSIGSSTSGVLISRIGITNPVIRTGLLLWTSGAGGRMSWHKDTHIAVLVICQLIEGIGVGCCFQPAMIALLANTEKADRAVATGLRNFIRTTGGAVGLSIGSSILNNVLIANIPPTVSAADALQFTNLYDLTPEERDGVIDAYMKGIQTIMYLGAPMVGVMLLGSLILTEVRLDSLVPKPAVHVAKDGHQSTEANSGETTDPSSAKAEVVGEGQLFGGEVEAIDVEKGLSR